MNGATAGTNDIFTNGPGVVNGKGGVEFFSGSAGNATIINEGSLGAGGIGGITTFFPLALPQLMAPSSTTAARLVAQEAARRLWKVTRPRAMLR